MQQLEDTFASCNANAVRTIRYLRGDYKPNYPVPATGYDASIASNHRWVTGGPKVILTLSYINGFIEGLEEILANS